MENAKYCSNLSPMEKVIRRMAGTLVTASLALGYFVSPWWFLLTAFVGLNLLQSSFTNWCLAEQILFKLGIGRQERDTSRTTA